jgi:multicomponent Na+:H+ antiporter subunit F
MAGLDPWVVAAAALVPALGLCIGFCARGPASQRLVAAQMAGSVATFLIACLTFALREASSVDLALALALLTLPATLLYALFLERWL